MQLAGHGKDPRLVQPELPIPTKGKTKRKPSLPKGIKVGDMITYLNDGTIGEVASLGDRHISITTANGVQNHDLDVDIPKLEIHTHPNQSVVFAIGDRVTLCSPTYDVSNRFGTVATVIEKKWDKKIGCTRIKVQYEDGYIYPSIEGAGWFKKIEEEAVPEQGFKVGDRIKDKDGFIGVITSISDRCINAENGQFVKSWNLQETSIDSIGLKLVDTSTENFVPEQEDFAISISGEAIIYDPNAKPVAINLPEQIDESYIESFKVGDRIRFRDGYVTNLKYELGTGVITDIDEINIKVIWDGETDSDRYTRFHIAHKQWWEKVRIDAVELPVFEDAIAVSVGTIVKPKFNGGKGKVVSSTKKKISVSWFGANNVVTYTIAEFHNQINILSVPIPSIEEKNSTDFGNPIATEPIESVKNLCIDEDCSTVLVRNDRLSFLLEQKQKLIASGATPEGVWINCGKVPKRNFEQAVWKSKNPRPEWGDKKSKYIGERGKEAHISAIAQHKAGQELRKIEREIKKLQQVKA